MVTRRADTTRDMASTTNLDIDLAIIVTIIIVVLCLHHTVSNIPSVSLFLNICHHQESAIKTTHPGHWLEDED